MNKRILVLNSGSSSIKFALFGTDSLAKARLQGAISGLGGNAAFDARDGGDRPFSGKLPSAAASHETALAWLFDWLQAHLDGVLAAAGHRVVHGGEQFTEPVLITAQVCADLEKLAPLAPLHQPKPSLPCAR
jgi:acetate kinase